jgi:hypothetical protein
MYSRCWMTLSQVGLQADARMGVTKCAGGRDMLSSTVAHALPACCVPEASTARLQIRRGAKHGQLTDLPLMCV